MMSRRTRFGALFLVVLGTSGMTGCKRLTRKLERVRETVSNDDSAAVKLTKAPTASWKDAEVTFPELPKARGTFLLRGTEYAIDFHSLPVGTKVTVDSQTVIADSSSVSIKIDRSKELAALPPKDAFDYRYRWDPKIRVVLDFGEVMLPLTAPSASLSYGMTEAFKKVENAPLSLPRNPANKDHSIAYVGSITPEVIGPAKTLGDVDWVAIESELPHRQGRTCGGYRAAGAKTGPEKSYQLEMIDKKITVYDRETSKEIASKDFAAADKCPMMSFDGAKSYPATEAIKTWLRAVRTKA